MDRNDLLENVRNYSPMEIARAIKNGVITLYDLKKYSGGRFSPLMQRRVQEILSSGEILEEPQTVQEPQDVQEPPKPQDVQEAHESQEPTIVTPSGQEENTGKDGEIPAPFKPEDIPQEIDPEDITIEEFASEESGEIPCEFTPEETELPPPPPPFSSPFYPPPPPPEAASHPDTSTFSWGGLFLGWIWGICNGVYWSMLSLVFSFLFFVSVGIIAIADSYNSHTLLSLILVGSILGKVIINFTLGILGVKSAWNAKRYESVGEFERIQKRWNVAGLVVFVVMMVIGFLISIEFF